MRFVRNFAPLVVALASATGVVSDQVVERDVVVIGGGSSGTYAAIRLADKGKSVVLLEKENHLGGHTNTYTDPDTKQPFNLGVAVYHNNDIVKNYFSSLNVPLAVTSPGGEGNSTTVFADFSTGKTVPGYQPVSNDKIGAAIQKYAGILAQKYPYLSLGYDLPNPVPEELLQPYGDFIKTNGLGDIVAQANQIAGANGKLLERATLYGLKVFGLDLIQTISQGFLAAASGNNGDLYTAAQSKLAKGNNVVLSARITKVQRNNNGVQVWANTPTGKVQIKAKKLVFGVAPTLQNLQSIGLDLTWEERAIFCKFNGFLYGSAVFTHPGMSPSKAFINIGTNTPYNLLNLPGLYTIGPLATHDLETNKFSTYFGGLDPNLGDEAAKSIIRSQLKNLQQGGQIGKGEPQLQFFTNHSPYHMYASADDIRRGFYKNLYGLEGKSNTYWTGAAFVDNDSSLIWAWFESTLLDKIVGSL